MAVAAARVVAMAQILRMKSRMPRALFHLDTGGWWAVFLAAKAFFHLDTAATGGVFFDDFDSVIGIGISPVSLVE